MMELTNEEYNELLGLDGSYDYKKTPQLVNELNTNLMIALHKQDQIITALKYLRKITDPLRDAKGVDFFRYKSILSRPPHTKSHYKNEMQKVFKEANKLFFLMTKEDQQYYNIDLNKVKIVLDEKSQEYI